MSPRRGRVGRQPALRDHTGYWLRLLSNHVHHCFQGRLKERGVTVAEWVVLRTLFDDDQLKVTELARRLCMTAGAVSRLVERLHRKGFVKRESSKEDRRAASVSLSHSGRNLVPELCRCADANEAVVFGVLTGSDRRALTRIVQKLVEAHEIRGSPTD